LASALNQEQLLRLARHGASARLKELRDEIASIESAFPDLRSTGRGNGRAGRRASTSLSLAAAGVEPATNNQPSNSGRRAWTPAQRKAAAERMRAYWAKRHAGRKK
jgi:hypothetical protein